MLWFIKIVLIKIFFGTKYWFLHQYTAPCVSYRPSKQSAAATVDILESSGLFSYVLVHTASFWNITIQWTSHDDFTEFFLCLSILNSNWKNSWNQSVKKVTQMIWQNFSVLALKNVSKTFKSIWKPNPCMDPLEKKFYYISFHSSFCRTSPFHREWLVLINILMI